MILGFDLDNVLYPWSKAITTWLRVNNDYMGREEEIATELDSLPEMYQDFLVNIEPVYNTFPPSKQDMATMYRLAKQYDILYITTRPESVRFATETYLRRYNYPNYNDLTISKDKELDVQLAGCDYFVEDRLQHARKLKSITNVILFKQPYNWDAECEFEHCICNLQELERILL